MKEQLKKLQYEHALSHAKDQILEEVRSSLIRGGNYDGEVLVIFIEGLKPALLEWSNEIGLTMRTTDDPTSAYFGLGG